MFESRRAYLKNLDLTDIGRKPADVRVKVQHIEIGKDREIVIPSDIVEELNVEAGEKVVVEIRNGTIVIEPEHVDAIDELAGLWAGLWPAEDAQDYVNRIRDEW